MSHITEHNDVDWNNGGYHYVENGEIIDLQVIERFIYRV